MYVHWNSKRTTVILFVFYSVEPETAARYFPVFSLVFTFYNQDWKTTELGDYEELSVVTTEFLGGYFSDYFGGDEPAQHYQTDASVQVLEDARKVDLHIRSSFIVPGDVPTVDLMMEVVENAFGGTSVRNYIAELKEMSSTNPYHHTKSVELVTHSPDGIAGNGSTSSRRSARKRKSVMIPFLVGLGFLVLVVLGLLWVRRRRDHQEVIAGQIHIDGDGDSAFTGGERNDPIKPNTTTYSTRFYGTDNETLRYLNSIRSKYKYRDDENASKQSGSSTELEEVSLDASSDSSEDGDLEQDMQRSDDEEDTFQEADLLSLNSAVPVMSDLLAKLDSQDQNGGLPVIAEDNTVEGEEEYVGNTNEGQQGGYLSDEKSFSSSSTDDQSIPFDNVSLGTPQSVRECISKSATASVSSLVQKFDYLREMNVLSIDSSPQLTSAEEEKAEIEPPVESNDALGYLQAMNSDDSSETEDLRSIT